MLDLQMKQPTTLKEVISYMRALEEQLRWALSNIDGEQITEGTIQQKQLGQGAVSSANIQKGAVTGDALGEGAIADDKLSESVWADIDKKIKTAGSGLIASNELKEKINDLIGIAEIDWHKIVDDNGQIMTAEGQKIRFARLAISADNLRGIADGQILIKGADGIYAITTDGTEKMTITADGITEDGMKTMAETISAETLLGREDMQTELAAKMPAELMDREDIMAKINALIDAKLGGE